jgi:hypothetical protein
VTRHTFLLYLKRPRLLLTFPLIGKLISVDNLTARGWVCDLRHPEKPLPVEAFVDGQRVAHGWTETQRQDVVEKHQLQGRHGFTLKLDETVLDHLHSRIKVVVPNMNCVPFASSPHLKWTNQFRARLHSCVQQSDSEESLKKELERSGWHQDFMTYLSQAHRVPHKNLILTLEGVATDLAVLGQGQSALDYFDFLIQKHPHLAQSTLLFQFMKKRRGVGTVNSTLNKDSRLTAWAQENAFMLALVNSGPITESLPGSQLTSSPRHWLRAPLAAAES